MKKKMEKKSEKEAKGKMKLKDLKPKQEEAVQGGMPLHYGSGVRPA